MIEAIDPNIGIVNVNAVVNVDGTEITIARVAVVIASVDVPILKIIMVKEVVEVHEWVEITSVHAGEEHDM